MRELLTMNKVLFTAIGGLLGNLFGRLDGLLYALVVFVIIDYLTGVMAAIVEKNLASSIGFRGIFKKVVLFFIVMIAQLIDTEILNSGGSIRAAVIFFYLSNEGVSILENAIRIGLPVPQKLKNILNQLHEEE